MKTNEQSFNRLLEQYVYKMLEKTIDQVDSDMQAQLINLFSSLHDQSDAEPPQSASTPQFATQASNFQREDIGIFRDLFVSHQSSIKATSLRIQQIDVLINRASKGKLRLSTQLRLINKYQSIRERFVGSLEKTQLFCETELFKRLVQAG